MALYATKHAKVKSAAWIFCWLVFGCSSSAHSESLDPIVMVSSTNSNLKVTSHEHVRQLYLGLRRTDSNNLLVTQWSRKEQEIREEFYRVCCNLGPVEFRAYWSKQVFTGASRPPKALSLDELVMQLVDDPTSIGFVRRSELNDEPRLRDLELDFHPIDG